ncbi:hypothetical protein C7974DRAFT_219920 [Boeremia exigua]|uniref:uncharacterized protein n=1 Tax=Boeremia exigua TaxID=749465 RepID=UPI001E8E7903|nr:uncharacterized protein C7974DRAFT_219920 [Boeremia exigua]KAH6622319.1 hypothetical protein C7974DRAFT_219920 [Boeremia exigua]
MTTLSPDVRDSTLRSLKLHCPSAEGLPVAEQSPDSFHSPTMEPNPFEHADTEWSDEEELIPRRRRRTQHVPPPVKVTRGGETSSEGSSGSPLVPPKSPSRPDVRPGSSQEDLVQRFYQVTRERDALRKELQRKSMGSNGLPARGSTIFKSEEKTLIEELQALRYEIRVWSEEYFSGPTSSRSKRPHLHAAKDLFGGLTDNYSVYLKHPNDRPLLVQAYIWSTLQKKIFNNFQKGSGYVWAGKLGDKNLRPINDTLRKAVKNEAQAEEYHQWRSMTVNLLVPREDGKWRPTFDAAPVLKSISRLCSRMRRKLRPYSTRSLRDSKEQLKTIFSASVALDLKMKRQLADYRFVTFTGGKPNQFWGYGYYDSEMEDVYDDSEDSGSGRGGYGDSHSVKARRVELALAPALERCGNANGHVFDQSFILVKADVSCKRLQRQEKPARPKPSSRNASKSFGGMWHRGS